MFENDLESRNQARWNGLKVGWDQSVQINRCHKKGEKLFTPVRDQKISDKNEID